MGDVLGRRIFAAAIDAALILILLVVVAKTLGDEGAARRSIWAETQGSPRAVFLLLTFAYFVATELAWAQTIGKRVMKLRVATVDGGRAAPGAIALRNVVRFVDWLPGAYIIGAITVYATGSRRMRLGDLAAKTTVVAVDAAPPAPSSSERPEDDVLAQIMR